MGGRSNDSGFGDYNRELGGEYSTLAAAEDGMGYGNGGAADQWIAGLSKSEIKSIIRYGDGAFYGDFNSKLREGGERYEAGRITAQGMNKNQLKVLNDLDNALSRSVLDKPMVVTRAAWGTEFDVKTIEGTPEQIASRISAQKGRVMVDHGFTSTTAKGGNTSWQDNPLCKVIYHIKTPAGKGIGGYVGGVIKSDYHRNDVTEFLYNRGSAIRIDGAYAKGSKVHINATYIGRQKSGVQYKFWKDVWRDEHGG